ncbi:MAG: SDR family NAD(P)-dependent oxidoreductase [Chloroflexi bacterium]|nr:SDR family NAD(P)-dependent oxidoreductase [Chloroflexota bacterium]
MENCSAQTIVITGSSRGFGKSLALELQIAGARVVISSREADAVKRAVGELPRPADALGVACDVRDFDQMRALADAALQKFGGIDVWINNAGVAHRYEKMLAVDHAAWRASFETNFFGAYHGCRVALDAILPRQRGQIINILGAGAFKAAPNQSAYGASKSALARLTETLAQEYADNGIAICAIQPGIIWTEMILDAQGVDDPKLRARFDWAKRVFGNPPEIPAWFIVELIARGSRNGKMYRVVTPRMFVPRMIGELFGAGKRHPQPWTQRPAS